MQASYRSLVLGGVWSTIVVAVVLLTGAESLPGRLGLALFVLVPALVVARFWQAPPATLSEQIGIGRR